MNKIPALTLSIVLLIIFSCSKEEEVINPATIPPIPVDTIEFWKPDIETYEDGSIDISTVEYKYDKKGLIQSRKRSQYGNIYVKFNYVHDDLNRITSYETHDKFKVYFKYNENGSKIEELKRGDLYANHTLKEWDFDENGRESGYKERDGSSLTQQRDNYTYDASGNITSYDWHYYDYHITPPDTTLYRHTLTYNENDSILTISVLNKLGNVSTYAWSYNGNGFVNGFESHTGQGHTASNRNYMYDAHDNLIYYERFQESVLNASVTIKYRHFKFLDI